jgi:hypothetical protein
MNKQRDVLKVPDVLQGVFTGASCRGAVHLMMQIVLTLSRLLVPLAV